MQQQPLLLSRSYETRPRSPTSSYTTCAGGGGYLFVEGVKEERGKKEIYPPRVGAAEGEERGRGGFLVRENEIPPPPKEDKGKDIIIPDNLRKYLKMNFSLQK